MNVGPLLLDAHELFGVRDVQQGQALPQNVLARLEMGKHRVLGAKNGGRGVAALVRNLPPVAGNITWARHLLKRIEEPMKKFQCNPSVLAGRDAKKIIRMYNKMAKTLVEFETLWYIF